MGVDYTASVVVGVLLTDSEVYSITSRDDDYLNDSFNDFTLHAGDCYGNGTQHVVGVRLARSNWGFERADIPDMFSIAMDVAPKLMEFEEKFGIQLSSNRIQMYVGMYIH